MHRAGSTDVQGVRTLAERVRDAEPEALTEATRGFLALRADNLVERPWGGARLAGFKGLNGTRTGRFGESFEVAAFADDPESRAHPSVVVLADGSELLLTELLEAAGPRLLGHSFFDVHGPRLPVLPKLLDVKELLSVQGHPPGHPELYVVVDAEPGASLRLGFAGKVDRRAFRSLLFEGLEAQRALLALMRTDLDPSELQRAVAPALAGRFGDDALLAAVSAFLRVDGDRAEVARKVGLLGRAYRAALDAMNVLQVEPGQVIFNAVAGRGPSGLPSSDVHALGNAEQRGMLILEIRRPGPTLRAWDHVRFPAREIDLDGALDAVNLDGTPPESFRVEPRATDDPAVERLVACDAFVVDRIQLGPGAATRLLTRGLPQTLHALKGEVELAGDEASLRLARGRSTVVAAPLGAYEVRAGDAGAEVVRVTVPVAGGDSVR